MHGKKQRLFRKSERFECNPEYDNSFVKCSKIHRVFNGYFRQIIFKQKFDEKLYICYHIYEIGLRATDGIWWVTTGEPGALINADRLGALV